jgi:phage/plasmid-like protein (TIGR03299 family)
MADELDQNQATGRKAMFAVGESPWHKEGFLLNEAPTFEEGMRLAGCNYEVEARPVHVAMADGVMSTSPFGQAIVRLDRGTTLGEAVLSVVGDGYVPLQNVDAFGVLEPLLDKGVAHLETGGTLRGGRDAWMLVRFDIDDPVVREVFADEIVPFGMITNNHSGEARAMVMQTPIRVVCANTLGQAMVGWKDRADVIAIGHRGDAKVKMVDAAERMFAGIVERYRVIATSYAAMKARILTVEEFTNSVLDVASPLPGDLGTVDTDHLTVRGYDLARRASENRRSAISTAWESGKGHKGDHSAWEAYNGAVEVIDHDADLFRTRGSRVASLLSGRLLEAKGSVLNAVAGLCGIERPGR